MATRELSYSARVPDVTPEAAIDWYADLRNTVGLQPLVEGAEVVSRDFVASCERTEWRVTERPGLGPLRYRIRFAAWMTRVAPDRLATQVRAAAGTRLEGIVSASVDPDDPTGVVIAERVTIHAPALTIRYVAAQAGAAHAEAFRRMPTLLRA